MAWRTPKTNWKSTDYFNLADYQRIYGNLNELISLANALYGDIGAVTMTNKTSTANVLYASELNSLEDNLHLINDKTVQIDIGTKQTFVSFGKFITWDELNRIESATLALYERLKNQYDGRKMFAFRFNVKEVF